MKKSFKQVIASVMAVSTISASVVALTANAENRNFYFYLGNQGGHEWSSVNPKDDNEQQAYIHTTSGSVSSWAPAYFTLYKSNNNSGTPLAEDKISNSKTISSLTGTTDAYIIPYTTYRDTGSHSYIYAYAGYYGTTANGYWYS